MWHRPARLCALLLCIGCAANQSLAAAQLVNDARYLEGEYSLSYPGGSTGDGTGIQPQSLGEDFLASIVFSGIESPSTNASVSSLTSQTSSVSLARSGSTDFDSLQATGRSIGESRSAVAGETGNSQTQNIMSIDFVLSTPHTYSLEGALSTIENFEGDASASATSTVSLQEMSRANFAASVRGAGPVDMSGLLQPGTYRLAFEALVDTSVSGIGSANGNASFEQIVFELVEVPEPASLGLLAIGAGMVQLRRRKRG